MYFTNYNTLITSSDMHIKYNSCTTRNARRESLNKILYYVTKHITLYN